MPSQPDDSGAGEPFIVPAAPADSGSAVPTVDLNPTSAASPDAPLPPDPPPTDPWWRRGLPTWLVLGWVIVTPLWLFIGEGLAASWSTAVFFGMTGTAALGFLATTLIVGLGAAFFALVLTAGLALVVYAASDLVRDHSGSQTGAARG